MNNQGKIVKLKEIKVEEKEKRLVVPSMTTTHDDTDSGLWISVNLAGAPKETVELEMGEAGLCVKAEAEDFRYESCFMLAHKIKPEKAEAKFDSGLLRIHAPFEDTMRGHKVPVE